MTEIVFKNGLKKKNTIDKNNIEKILFSNLNNKKNGEIKNDDFLEKEKIIILNDKLQDTISQKEIWETSIIILCSFISVNHITKTNEISSHHIDIIKYLYNSINFIDNYIEKEFKHHIPFIPIEETIHEDYLICLEDGKKVKLLGSYISKKFEMTPQDYIKKWNLPHNYPFTCLNLTKQRKETMKKTKPWERINKK